MTLTLKHTELLLQNTAYCISGLSACIGALCITILG